MTDKQRLYVITRSSERPKYFAENVASIREQNLPDGLEIVHLVSYDSPSTYEYLKDYSDLVLKSVQREERRKPGHFPYNLYCNQLHELIDKPGWVMYLDDDDIYESDLSVQKIAANFDSTDNLIIWKVMFPEGIKPAESRFKRKVVYPKGFPAICFCYHTKWLKHAVWDERKGADGRLIFKLSQIIPNKVWIPEVLTRINYETGYGGLGQRQDIK